MKQELKEILGYLPYGVKVKAKLKHDSGLPIDYSTGFVVLDTFSATYIKSEFEYFKLVLRPLRDLTQKIQKAEYYTSFLGHLLRECYNEDINENTIDVVGLRYSIIDKDNAWFKIDFSDIGSLPNKVVNWLYEHHFDIHNLIEQKKAININTLEI